MRHCQYYMKCHWKIICSKVEYYVQEKYLLSYPKYASQMLYFWLLRSISIKIYWKLWLKYHLCQSSDPCLIFPKLYRCCQITVASSLNYSDVIWKCNQENIWKLIYNINLCREILAPIVTRYRTMSVRPLVCWLVRV